MAQERATRWSDRWRGVLDDGSAGAARRLTQGAAAVRAGRVTDLRVATGVLSGAVHGDRAVPATAEAHVAPLDDAAWATVVAVVAGQVRHSARLLAGHALEGLAEELTAVGVDLFPSGEAVTARCSCAARESVCVHVAAVWEGLAAGLDEDPFLLLRLRGRGRQQLLADVSSTRRQGAAAPDRAALPVAEVDAGRWARARVALSEIEIPTARQPRTSAPAILVRGDPPGWAGGVRAWALFRPLVERGAAWAADLFASGDDQGHGGGE
jgi:uncharacterized Zn finger protein